MNVSAELPADPVAAFEYLVAETASRLESINAALAEVTAMPSGLNADDEIARRKAAVAQVADLEIERDVVAERLQSYREGLTLARRVKADHLRAEARVQAVAATEKVAAKLAQANAILASASEDMLALSTAAALGGVRLSHIAEVGIGLAGEVHKVFEHVQMIAGRTTA